MGLDSNGVRLALYAKSMGADFSRSATLGRQWLALSQLELKRVLAEFGCHPGDRYLSSLMARSARFVEEFLRCLGARETHSFDVSDYEGATHIHDWNQPIPEAFKEQYTVFIDGGSLEHIFNFPVAIRNCMEMLEVGGHLIISTPTNNWMGHGFYQFSPELFFNVLSPANGFEVVRIMLYEDRVNPTWYSVKSPAEVRGRVLLVNGWSTYMGIVARRVDRVPIFQTTPQQSDYLLRWNEAKDGAHPHRLSGAALWKERVLRVWRRLPMPIKYAGHRVIRTWQRGFQKQFYQPMRLTENAAVIQPLFPPGE